MSEKGGELLIEPSSKAKIVIQTFGLPERFIELTIENKEIW